MTQSTSVNINRVISSRRWDFDYFDPEYTDMLSKINNAGWSVKKLEELISNLTDGQHGYLTHLPDGIPLLRTSNVFENEIRLNDVRYIAPEVHAEIKRSQLKPGDVLLTTVGSIGLAAVVDSSLGEANINQNLVKMTPKESLLHPAYLAAFLNSRAGRVQIERTASKSVVPIVNYPRLREILVPLPPLKTQERIAQIMQDAYSNRHKKLIEAGQLLRGIENYVLEVLGIHVKHLINERRFVVNRSKLTRADVRYHLPIYTGLEQAIEDGTYPTKVLGEFCEKISNGVTPSYAGYTDEGCAVIKVASITRDWRIDWEKVAFTSEAFFAKSKKAHIKERDLVLLSASHQIDYIGRNFALVQAIPGNFANRIMAVGELIIVRMNQQQILPEYMLACLTITPIQELINRMTRGQSAHLYAEDLKDLRIPAPPLQVQQSIIEELAKRRSEAEQLKAEADILVFNAKSLVEQMILHKGNWA